MSDHLVLSNESGQVLAHSPGRFSGKAAELSSLENCRIFAIDSFSKVSVELVRDSSLFIGPVGGVCHIRRCTNCVIGVVAKQVSLVECKDCIIYLRTESDTMVQGCERIKIGKVSLELSDQEERWKALERDKAGLHIQGDGAWRRLFELEGEEKHKQQKEKSWEWIEAGQALVDEEGNLSPLATAKLREIFDTFDVDLDAGLSYEEFNAFQTAIHSDELVNDAEELKQVINGFGFQLDRNLHLPFTSFVDLYRLQGLENLKADLEKLGLSSTELPSFQIDEQLGATSKQEPEQVDQGKASKHQDSLSEVSDFYDDEDFEEEEGRLPQSKNSSLSEPESKTVVALREAFRQQVAQEASQESEYMDDEFNSEGFSSTSSSSGSSRVSGEEGKDGVSGVASAESKENEGGSFDVVESAILLCIGARHRGVNLHKWFANYDHENRSSLPRKAFETAFSALLLGLCAGSSTEFVQEVERILDPQALEFLCDQLADPSNRKRVNFMPLVNLSKQHPKMHNQSLSTSFVSQPELNTVNEDIASYVSGLSGTLNNGEATSVKDPDQYEKLKESIQSWKWSQGGRTPTHKGGAWTSSGEFISAYNLRSALRASLGINFALGNVIEFAKILEDQIESPLETRLRTREESMLANLGKPAALRNGGESVPDNASPDESFDAEVSPIAASKHKLITVSALMRWLGSLRRTKKISRDDWLTEKKKLEKRQLQQLKHLLDAALEGDSNAIQELRSKDELRRKILNQVQIIPEWAVTGEARSAAKAFLSTHAGQSQIRRREIYLTRTSQQHQDEAEEVDNDEDPDAHMSHLTASERAREQVLAEKAKEEQVALEEKVEAREALFLEFCNGHTLGTVSGSFEGWLRDRERERKKKRAAMQNWRKSKGRLLKSVSDGSMRVCVAIDLFTKLREWASLTCRQQKDEKNGILVCRSSRYEGLDVEHAISVLVKKKTDEVLCSKSHSVEQVHDLVASISSGEFLLSYAESKEAFQGILASLIADPKTSAAAFILLDAPSVAKKKLAELLKTKRGQQRLETLMEVNDLPSKVAGREALSEQIEDELLCSLGFRIVENDEDRREMLESAKNERKTKAVSEYQRWLKKKAKEHKMKRKEEKKKMKEQQTEQKLRKVKSEKEYRRWKRAAAKNQYYTVEAADSEGKKKRDKQANNSNKPRRVLKARGAKPDPETIDKLLARPAWVVE